MIPIPSAIAMSLVILSLGIWLGFEITQYYLKKDREAGK